MPETNALFAPLNWVWESPGIAIAGGDWHATLPLANLLSPEVPDCARSTSAARAATRFTLAFGASRRPDTVGVFFANLAKDALARIRLHDLALAAIDMDFRGGDLPAPFAFSRGSAARYSCASLPSTWCGWRPCCGSLRASSATRRGGCRRRSGRCRFSRWQPRRP